MIWVIILVLALLYAFSIVFRTFVNKTPISEYYALKDLYYYMRYKAWNNINTGQLICYAGLFGQGKTLNMCNDAVAIYKRGNNRKIYDSVQKKVLLQKVVILSNVNISVPYIKLTSLRQVVDLTKVKDADGEVTKYIVLIDEMSSQLSSRQWKDNIDTPLLNSILTCRHYHMSIYYTSQRFGLVDALMRQVTQHVIQCNKVWRIYVRRKYDAWELENCTNVMQVKPLAVSAFFATDKAYNVYDTLACVDDLIKGSENGDRLTDEEIIALRNIAEENLGKQKRKYKSRIR